MSRDIKYATVVTIVHYNGVIMSLMGSQITSVSIVCLTVDSDRDQRKHQTPRHWPLYGNSPLTGEFPAQRASNAENVSISRRHYVDVEQNCKEQNASHISPSLSKICLRNIALLNIVNYPWFCLLIKRIAWYTFMVSLCVCGKRILFGIASLAPG